MKEHGVAADVWSATSYQQLRNEALDCERWNRLHPTETPRVPYVSQVLEDADGPIVAVSDYMRSVPDQVARWIPEPYVSLGTDGFGRSDTRDRSASSLRDRRRTHRRGGAARFGAIGRDET